MLKPNLEQLLHGFLVLRATQRVPTLPPLDRLGVHVESSHLEGSYYGTVVNGGVREPVQFFYPQRSRHRRIFSATEEFYSYNDEASVAARFSELEKQHDLEDNRGPFDLLVESQVQAFIEGPHLLAVDQVGLNASVTLMARNVELRFYGLHAPTFDLLVWTNLGDYARVLHQYPYDAVWVHPFEPVNHICRVLHTNRLCSRWYRWSQNFNTLQSFAALERLILGKVRG